MTDNLKNIVRFVFFFLLFSFCHDLWAQNGHRARGISPPGRLELEIRKISTKNEMICTANYQDINNDGILSPDETIDINIFVRNYSMSTPIQPKIEMIKRIGRNRPPTMHLVGLKQINPGEMGSHKEPVSWKQDFDPGILVLRVRAIDSLSGFKTDWMDVTLQIENPLKAEEPESIDSDL